MKNCFAFLTRFPVSKDINIFKEVAPKMWLFPIVGFVLGLLSSFISLILINILPFLVVGFITLGFLLFMTGLHHTDGLLDFGDGLMVMGSPERKIEVMHDVSIGTGGFTLALIVLSLTGIAISYLMDVIIIALVISEIGAKFGMVAACSVGKSAKTTTADPFISVNNKKKMLLSLLLSIGLIYFTVFFITIYNSLHKELTSLVNIISPVNTLSPFNTCQLFVLLLIFLMGTFIPLLIVLKLANRNFNGLTGDCLGALNEITRLFILILTLIFNSLRFI